MWYSNSGEPNGRRRRRRSAVGQSSISIMYFKPTKALISIFWSGAAVLRFRESPIEPDRFDEGEEIEGSAPALGSSGTKSEPVAKEAQSV